MMCCNTSLVRWGFQTGGSSFTLLASQFRDVLSCQQTDVTCRASELCVFVFFSEALALSRWSGILEHAVLVWCQGKPNPNEPITHCTSVSDCRYITQTLIPQLGASDYLKPSSSCDARQKQFCLRHLHVYYTTYSRAWLTLFHDIKGFHCSQPIQYGTRIAQIACGLVPNRHFPLLCHMSVRQTASTN